MEGFRSLSAAGSTLALLLTLSAALDSSVISLDVGVAEPDPDHVHRSPDEVWAMYESWLAREGKSHASLGEKRTRFGVFADNLGFIDEHNGKADATYRLGLNRFADLTNEEYRRMYLGVKGGLSRRGGGRRFGEKYRVAKGEELPSEVDWRKEGAVAGVKDQGGCRSGWAFSTIAAVEGINKIETGNFITLSEQELLDCDQGFNQGCNGGRADYAYEFIINNGGIDTAEDYPYKGEVGKCDPARKHAKIVFIDHYGHIPVNEEMSLKKAVASQPVSVIIEGAGRAFQLYESGIFTGECGTELDHGVTVVGYGTENGRDHWIVKNSWGERWGEGGYIRMDRNVADTETGKCGIAMEASYPVKTGQNQSGSRAFSSAI